MKIPVFNNGYRVGIDRSVKRGNLEVVEAGSEEHPMVDLSLDGRQLLTVSLSEFESALEQRLSLLFFDRFTLGEVQSAESAEHFVFRQQLADGQGEIVVTAANSLMLRDQLARPFEFISIGGVGCKVMSVPCITTLCNWVEGRKVVEQTQCQVDYSGSQPLILEPSIGPFAFNFLWDDDAAAKAEEEQWQPIVVALKDMRGMVWEMSFPRNVEGLGAFGIDPEDNAPSDAPFDDAVVFGTPANNLIGGKLLFLPLERGEDKLRLSIWPEGKVNVATK